MNYCELEPKAFFQYFRTISKIPRNSGEEEEISDYLYRFAKDRRLTCYRDKNNNVLIRKPATEGYEHCKTILFQGHTDMVCEKEPDSSHDFKTMPIEIIQEGNILRAKGTTLGADDGVAVAYMLMLLDSADIPHPPLECLFTTEEETGLYGASCFDYTKIRAAYMINLDGEKEGQATVSCAGGVRCYYEKKLRISKLKNEKTYQIAVSGLCGGHSGADIHKNRMNANRVLAEILQTIHEKAPLRLCSFCGGSKDNAIPFSAAAEISCKDRTRMISALMESDIRIRAHLSPEDKGFKIELTEGQHQTACSKKDTTEILSFLLAHENDVIALSPDINGLVETSANIGIVHYKGGDDIHISVSLRSSIDSEKERHRLKNKQTAREFGFRATYGQQYPGWEYRRHSKLRQIYCSAYEKTHDKKQPEISAIHAGLECGIIANALPELDIIALGPTMDYVHTPKEYLDIPSVARLHQTIVQMLADMKEE